MYPLSIVRTWQSQCLSECSPLRRPDRWISPCKLVSSLHHIVDMWLSPRWMRTCRLRIGCRLQSSIGPSARETSPPDTGCTGRPPLSFGMIRPHRQRKSPGLSRIGPCRSCMRCIAWLMWRPHPSRWIPPLRTHHTRFCPPWLRCCRMGMSGTRWRPKRTEIGLHCIGHRLRILFQSDSCQYCMRDTW